MATLAQIKLCVKPVNPDGVFGLIHAEDLSRIKI